MSVSVDGYEIAERDVLAEMQHHPAADAEAARAAAARALAVRELLLRGAEAAGLGRGDDAIEAFVEREAAFDEPDEAACRAFYERHRDRFRSPPLCAAQHILIAAAPDDADARAAAHARAAELLRQVEAAPESFDSLAAQWSDCPSKANGGLLGQVSPGDTVPEFETFLFALDEGEICAAPVESRYGYHVVRLLRRAESRELPYESAREAAAEAVREARGRAAIRDLIARLAAGAEIEGVDLAAGPE